MVWCNGSETICRRRRQGRVRGYSIRCGQAIAAEIGDAAVFQECDVTSEDHVSGLVDTAVSTFGKLDIMYNNAGIVGAAGPIATTPADEWHFTLDILINGVFYGVKHAARVMVPNEAGSIINMASTAGILGGQGPHAYATSKHAVIGLTKTRQLNWHAMASG